MNEVTRILSRLENGDQQAAERLLPLVYGELRRLAAAKLQHERPGHTLQATALVHEAYVRLVGVEHQRKWNSRGHFFAAAAEAMRRILVENARRKRSRKRGGKFTRQAIEDDQLACGDSSEEAFDLLALDEALDRLEAADAQAAAIVKLRYFSGLTVPQAAEALGVSTRTAERLWTYAKAWLFRELSY